MAAQKHAFTLAERWAVFKAHGSTGGTKCWLCGEPLNFREMAIDHVLPEHLIGDKEERDRALHQFSLPADFDLNSFENWLPAHGPCNVSKHDHIFRPTPLIQMWMDRARRKAARARDLCSEWHGEAQIAKAVAKLATSNVLSPQALELIAQDYARANSEQILTGTRTVPSTGRDVLGWSEAAPRYHYTPPNEVRLAPNLAVTFNPGQTRDANEPFTYTVDGSEGQAGFEIGGYKSTVLDVNSPRARRGPGSSL